MRLDKALAEERGISRTAAQRLIAEGRVSVGGGIITRPSYEMGDGDEINVSDFDGGTEEYVSRGGIKLAAALDAFSVDPAGLACIDIGASTGGFTDCLLRRGAASVCAIDVGENQLAPRIRADSRVRVVEKCNARYITAETTGGRCDLLVMDVSFISQRMLYRAIRGVMNDGADAVTLIKPQFEAGRGNVGKGGIVRDPAVHERVINELFDAAAAECLITRSLIPSPIKGGDGNREYLVRFTAGQREEYDRAACLEIIKRAVYQI